MNLKELKIINDYTGNKNPYVYIVPIQNNDKILSLLEQIQKTTQKYLKIQLSLFKKGTVCKINSLNGNTNAILIKSEYLLPILETLGLNKDVLIHKKLLFVKSKREIQSEVTTIKKTSKKQSCQEIDIINSHKGLSEKLSSWVNDKHKSLLKKSTKSEKDMVRLLKQQANKDIKTQQPFFIDNKIFFADICINSIKTIIEVDGGYHNTDTQQEKDKNRDNSFKSLGYKTIRIKNEDVDKNNVAFKDIIKQIKKS